MRQKNSSTASKIGVGMMKFMKGIQQASKAAQEYDKSSTVSTRTAWGKEEKSPSRKRKRRKSRRKK